MQARERTEVLSGLGQLELEPWKEEIEELGVVEVIHEPNLGLVMMRAEESVERTAFNVGEILIADATIELDGVQGYGAAMGGEAGQAYALSLIDALYHSSDRKWDELKGRLQAWLMDKASEQLAARRQAFSLVKRTRVDFEVMDTEED